MFFNDAKKKAIREAELAERTYNSLGESGNNLTMELYERRKESVRSIERVEQYVNSLANSPKEFKKDVSETIIKIKEFKEAVKIESENSSSNFKGAGVAISGVTAGGAIAALGPTAAMAIATTFGTASTGTAIASLSGAAATKAALAWLGGGALAAGGGGMAAGNALLALAGPVGWTIAGLTVVGGGAFAMFKNKKAAEEASAYARELRGRIAKLRPLIEKLRKLLYETTRLRAALYLAEFNLYPKDYTEFNTTQKNALMALINNTKALGELINERVA